ncbi:hypothetical protein R3P38DRAFT_3352470 [Favolaschia claudopus]|uniref:Uncharacterized protein n=1 Tax=Favolaschia claudopus TaxID=2862362 RepID=A0AAW0C376_9AGAR
MGRGGEGEVGGGEEEGEGGGDIVGAVGEDEDAGVEKAEGKAEEVWVKQGRVRVMGWEEEEEERDRTHPGPRSTSPFSVVRVSGSSFSAGGIVGRSGRVCGLVGSGTRYNYKGQREADGSSLEQKLSRAAQMGAGTPSAEGIISTLSSAPICCSGEQQLKAVWSSLKHTGFSLGLKFDVRGDRERSAISVQSLDVSSSRTSQRRGTLYHCSITPRFL